MPQFIPQLAIDDIADLPAGASLFGLQDGDELTIALMDIVIAIIYMP